MQRDEIKDLTNIFKENGDKLLDASSKLSISTSLLRKMNESFKTIFNADTYIPTFHVLPEVESLDQYLDLQVLYDFVQKTIGLKLFNECPTEREDIDVSVFKNLKLLEVQRFSMNLLRGLKSLRAQLEYLICVRGTHSLREVLENCGGDRVQGYIWHELKEVVFRHNNIDDIDASLEFVPCLNSIDLSHNRIHNAENINGLPNLKYLNLGFNYLEATPPFNGGICTALQTLILKNNYIENINDVGVLVNLRELDLSDNCLIDHNSLAPLASLAKLIHLKLSGNPLCYHPRHRIRTVPYLSLDEPREFLLDGEKLNGNELRSLGSYSSIDLSESFNSVTSTLTTVILNEQQSVIVTEAASDVDINSQCVITMPEFWLPNEGMQDSGIVAGRRPASPSGSSIGSAASLQSGHEGTVRYCESDIEVLSNPSQSSIEVLSSPRYVQSSSAIPSQITHDSNAIMGNDFDLSTSNRNKSL